MRTSIPSATAPSISAGKSSHICSTASVNDTYFFSTETFCCADSVHRNITATDDKDVNAQVDVSIVALTTDTDRRVTSAIADMAEPALTVVSDGGVTAPDLVKTKLELGEDYGMRGASALGKEWYEHSEGFCDALKGKTRTEIAGLSGGDADLKALCTIDITDLQKAALDALS